MNVHLHFNGDCEAAFRFYESCFAGKITLLLTFGESPLADQFPDAWREKILHASLSWGEHRITGADVPPTEYRKPQGFAVLVNVADSPDAERIFGALAEGGVVGMPLQQTFWAHRFGMLADRFGIPWMVNCG